MARAADALRRGDARLRRARRARCPSRRPIRSRSRLPARAREFDRPSSPVGATPPDPSERVNIYLPKSLIERIDRDRPPDARHEPIKLLRHGRQPTIADAPLRHAFAARRGCRSTILRGPGGRGPQPLPEHGEGTKKGGTLRPRPFVQSSCERGLEVHVAHAAHAAAAGMPPPPPPFLGASTMAASVVIIRPATEAASCRAVRTTLAGSMTPACDQVDVLFGLGVEAEGGRGVLQHLADHDRAFDAGVLGDLADRGLQGAAHDGDAGVLVVVVALEAVQDLGGLQQGDAAAGDDAFFDRRAGGVEGVVDAVLLFLHFDFGRAADADHRNAAGQLGQALLQLFLVVVARWCPRSGVLIWAMRRFDAGLVARRRRRWWCRPW